MFYLIRAHGSINQEEFIVPENYGFITLAESGLSRKSNENDFLIKVISKSLKNINKLNRKILKNFDKDVKKYEEKKRVFMFLLKSLLLPRSSSNLNRLLDLCIEELGKEDGDIKNLLIDDRIDLRKKDLDQNNFIKFIDSCFEDLDLVKSCESNKEKQELIIQTRKRNRKLM